MDRTSIILILLVATTTLAAAEPCPRFGLEPQVLTGTAARVTSDGGIVVGTASKMGDDVGTGEIAVQPDWRFRVDGKLVKPTVDVIAPGLAVYRPPPKATDLVLEDGKHARVGKATLAATIDTLPAPRARAVIVSSTHPGKHPSTVVEVEIDGAPPTGALALVLTGADGRAYAWGRPASTSNVIVYDTHQGCATFPNGTVLAAPGDRVLAFWVDAAGRRSATTPKLIVTSK